MLKCFIDFLELLEAWKNFPSDDGDQARRRKSSIPKKEEMPSFKAQENKENTDSFPKEHVDAIKRCVTIKNNSACYFSNHIKFFLFNNDGCQ